MHLTHASFPSRFAQLTALIESSEPQMNGSERKAVAAPLLLGLAVLLACAGIALFLHLRGNAGFIPSAVAWAVAYLADITVAIGMARGSRGELSDRRS